MNYPTKYIVWGCKNTYQTHTHIHEAFYHSLKGSGKDVQWLDACDNCSNVDWAGTFIITEHNCVPGTPAYWPWPEQRISTLPIRKDCFYAVHGLSDDPPVAELFKDIPHVSWNVFSIRGVLYDPTLPPISDYDDCVYLDTDTPFSYKLKQMEFRWATDLLPDEIEANKPVALLSLAGRVIYWVGTLWHVNEWELSLFAKACKDDGIEFIPTGAGQRGVVTKQDNINLIRSSYMAPAISGSHHLTEGYAPCRIFKNISYGQYGITNNPKVNEIFSGNIIFEPDPYKLYYVAKERLQSVTVQDLHKQMDFVAANHTYLNRLTALEQAAQMIIG